MTVATPTRPSLLTDELWLEIMDRLAPILGNVSQDSVKWAMKKTRTPKLAPGTAVSNVSGVVTISMDDGSTVRARMIGVAPAVFGDRVMVLHMPPSAMFCFGLYGFPSQGIEMVADSTVRPTVGLYAGRMIYEASTTKTWQYDPALPGWVCVSRLSGVDSYNTQILFGATAVTIGNGGVACTYNAIGNWIDVQITVYFGSSTNLNGGTGNMSVQTPSGFVPQFSLGGSNPYAPVGTASHINNGIGRTFRNAVVFNDLGSDRVGFIDFNYGAGAISHSSPYTHNANGNTDLAILRYRWR